MKWKIINRLCSGRADAEKTARGLEGKVRNPRAVYDVDTNSWAVVLYEDTDRKKIDEAMVWYRKKGVDAYVSKVEDK